MALQVGQVQPLSIPVEIDAWKHDFETKWTQKKDQQDILGKMGDAWKNLRSYREEEASLNTALTDIPSYIAQQDQVIAITSGALQLLLNGTTDKETVKFAKAVAKTGAAFLRHNTNPDKVEQYKCCLRKEQYAFASTLISFAEPTVSVVEKHAAFTYTLRQLRKQIKLATNLSKIEEIIHSAPTLKSVRGEKFERALKFLGVTLVHATKAWVIKSACEHTSQELVPSGELRTQKILPLTGELAQGSTALGINVHSLSGENLKDADIARKTALRPGLDLQTEKDIPTRYIMRKFSTIEDCLDGDSFTRALYAIKRMQAINPQDVDFQKLQEMHLFIEKTFTEKPSQIFNWRDDYYKGHFYNFIKFVEDFEKFFTEPSTSITKEDIALAQYPLVIGSTTAFAFPFTLTRDEYASHMVVRSHLKFGTDIKVVFTEPRFLQTVEDVLRQYDLDKSVTVESMDVLDTASQMERVVAPYVYDFYNSKKWEKELGK